MWFRIIEFRSAQTGADLFEIVELAATIRSDAFMGQIFQHIDDGPGDALEVRTDKSAAGDAAVNRRIADGDRVFSLLSSV